MAITSYYGAGSPFAWRAWLALEHKRLAHERKVLSLSESDLKKPDVSVRDSLPEPMGRWMRRIEELPIFRKTWPEHWN